MWTALVAPAADRAADLLEGETERLRPRLWGLLIIVFLASRLFHLSAFPLFIDEGMYLLFAEEVLQGVPAGLGDGKPLEGVAIAAGLVLGFEPALAARLPHVAAGLVTLLAIGAFGAHFLSRRAAVASMLLWTFLPYPLFFERLATPDVMLAGSGMMSLYLGARLAASQRPGPWLVLWTGGVTAATALVKMPVSFYFVLAPGLAWLLLARPLSRPRRSLALAMLPPALLMLAIGVIAGVRFYLGLHPVGFGFIHLAQKGSFHTGWSGLLSLFTGNLLALGRYLIAYLSLPLTLWLGVSTVLALGRGRAQHRYLGILGGLYLTVFLLGAELLFPRYLLPALPPLVLLMGWAAAGLLARVASAVSGGSTRRAERVRVVLDWTAAGFLLSLTLPFARTLFTEPHALSLPSVDRVQYVEGWASGFGFPAAARYLGDTLGRDPAAAAVALHVADGMRLRAYDSHGVLAARLEQVQIAARRTLDLAEQLRRLQRRVAAASRTYVVVNHRRTWSEGFARHFPDAVEVAAFPRPGGDPILVLALGGETLGAPVRADSPGP